MKLIFLAFAGLLFAAALDAQTYELPRSTPEAEGVESALIMNFFDDLMNAPNTEIHSAMVLRHGKVIAEMYPEPFAPEYRHTVYSASKTFTAIAVGLAVDENRLRVTDRVAAFFPEHMPEKISDNLAKMTVRDLLTMTAGIIPDNNVIFTEEQWLGTYLSSEVLDPGETFRYDNLASYTLSAIVQKVTGMTTFEYLKARMFTPMNIRDIGWELSPEGINTGGWGLHIQSEAMAKTGQLLLNKGEWKGQRIISSSWVEEMMKPQVWVYGYQMWAEGYPGAARADGAGGQYIVVVPDKDMVFVVTQLTTEEGSGAYHKSLIWKLLPEIKDEVLPPSKDYELLKKKTAESGLPMMKGRATSSLSKDYNGRTFSLEDSYLGWKSISFNFGKKHITAHITEAGGNEFDLTFGHDTWEKSIINTFPPYPIVYAKDRFKGIDCPFLAAGNYAWPEKDRLRLKIYYVNWISSLELDIRFEDEGISLGITEYFARQAEVRGR